MTHDYTRLRTLDAGQADKLERLCELIVPGESGRTAQEAHLFLIHYFCELIDAAF